NIVEREAVSIAHPSRFILVGTMNPEEGELRPQLLDRFALHITVKEIMDEKQRVEIIRNNIAFGERPVEFVKSYMKEQEALRRRIQDARKLLEHVKVDDAYLEAVASACISLNIDGHRPDIVTIRAAKTLAAFEGRREVTAHDILQVAEMAIGFRTRREGFDEPATPEEVRKAFTNALVGKRLLETSQKPEA
ncbi:MAG: magnesium chelatase, partial [Nitrososphaerota archaeon]